MLSTIFLIKQGQCCGNKCLMCPYTKKHTGKSKFVRKDVWMNLEKWEKDELNNIKVKIRDLSD